MKCTVLELIDQTPHHPAIEDIVEVICNKTQNTDKGFFRVTTAFFLSKMAAAMRAVVVTKDRGEIPVNTYALCLGTSGFGKGHSVFILENELLSGFKKRFLEDTLPVVLEASLWDFANSKAAKSQTDPQDEFDKATKIVKGLVGEGYPFTFDSGTAPAVKQLSDFLKFAKIGSINLQIDEIGSNLEGNTEILNVFLELFDQGLTKMKLIKTSNENKRVNPPDGKTPTNMLLFGTDDRLFDGGTVENAFYSFLETGYARRCLFAQGRQDRKAFHTMTAEEIYYRNIDPTNSDVINKWEEQFSKLADESMYNWQIAVEDEIGIKLLEYKIHCELLAEKMKDHEAIRKAEMSHRYFKTLKLAGAFAFLDQSVEVTLTHLVQAVKLVEESGAAFQVLLTREKPYVKLAKYIADIEIPVTHADLLEALSFYKSSQAGRNEMMNLAIAWGYPRHIVIKKSFVDGIEFFEGDSLKQTNLDDLSISVSSHFAYDYSSATITFADLEQLAVMGDDNGNPMNWCNHSFTNEHRSDENTIPGFDMIVIDVDGGLTRNVVHELLSDYKFMTYTTKRHGVDGQDRFRLVIPINYFLKLTGEEYKEFINSFLEWLPFCIDGVDDVASNQRSKKWLTNPSAICHTNTEGALLDVLPFIPRTTRNEQYKMEIQQVQSMDNLERWFAQRIATGNRNNNMIKFAFALVDSGFTLQEVNDSVYAFNKKLNNPLPDLELASTIMRSVAQRYTP